MGFIWFIILVLDFLAFLYQDIFRYIKKVQKSLFDLIWLLLLIFFFKVVSVLIFIHICYNSIRVYKNLRAILKDNLNCIKTEPKNSTFICSMIARDITFHLIIICLPIFHFLYSNSRLIVHLIFSLSLYFGELSIKVR